MYIRSAVFITILCSALLAGCGFHLRGAGETGTLPPRLQTLSIAGSPAYSEFGKEFRKTLKLSPEAPIIVGHTPLDREQTYWFDVGGAENHHILFSAGETWVGAFVGFQGRLQALRFPCEPLLELVNALPPAEQAAATA